MPKEIKQEIEVLAESVLSNTDFFLVSVEIKGAQTPEIWVFADGSERSINMDECAEISEELGFLMDAHEVFDGRYRLNVSSPGLSKPLVDRRQYPKNRGRKVKVKFKDAEGYHKLQGVLKDLTKQSIVISPENDEPFELFFNQIVETKVVPSLK